MTFLQKYLFKIVVSCPALSVLILSSIVCANSTVKASKSLAVWDISPWAKVLPEDSPPAGKADLTALRIVAGQKEYESQAFMVTNNSRQPQSVKVKLEGPLSRPGKWGGSIKLRHAVFMIYQDDGKYSGPLHETESLSEGKILADALPVLDHPLAIPAGQSRQVWLEVHTGKAAAGTYEGQIVLTGSDTGQHLITLTIEILPVRMPDELPLANQCWQYVDGKKDHYRYLQGVEKEAVADMAAHYVNVNILGRHRRWSDLTVENGDIDDQGNIIKEPDWSEFDYWVELCKPISRKGMTFFPSMKAFEEMKKGTPLYRTYSQWINRWVAHMKELGIGYDDFFAYPADEDNTGHLFFDSVKAIRLVDPRIRIFAIYIPDIIMRGTDGPLGELIADGKEPDWDEVIMASVPYVDNWCITRGSNYPQNIRLLLDTGKPIWSYFISMRGKPPYQAFRLHAWDAFSKNLNGCAFWSYASNRRGSGDQWNGGIKDWGVIYTLEGAPEGVSRSEPIIPSKRWEAWREGIEDYTYLYMLQELIEISPWSDQIAQAQIILDTAVEKVLGNPKDITLADVQRQKVLSTIVSLRSK